MSEVSYVRLMELIPHRKDEASVRWLMNPADGIVITKNNQILSNSLLLSVFANLPILPVSVVDFVLLEQYNSETNSFI